MNIDQSRTDEITSDLRPNPNLNVTVDDLGVSTHSRFSRQQTPSSPAPSPTFTSDKISASYASPMLKGNLDYNDKEIDTGRKRLETGSMSTVDFQRIEWQRIQFESDVATSEVNLRTAKIDLLQLLRERMPVDQFDVSASFDYDEPTTTIEDARAAALLARTNHSLADANGSADPTWSVDVGRQPPLVFYSGVSVSIPLRTFERNQGEKLKTQLAIRRNQKLLAASEVSIFHGAASLLDFLDAQKQCRDTELSYLKLVGTYLSGANQLNFAVGREVIR